MVKITPDGISFYQEDGTEHLLSHEAIQFYFELKKSNKIVKPLDPNTGTFVFTQESGTDCCYIPAGVTVAGKVFPGDLYTL